MSERLAGYEPTKDPTRVAIMMQTRYPGWYEGPLKDIADTDKVRGDLAIWTFEMLEQYGFETYVADSPDSSIAFQEQLKKFSLTVIPREKNDDRNVSFFTVVEKLLQRSDILAVLAMQPEKTTIIPSIDKIVNPLVKKRAVFSVPRRNVSLFQETTPEYMFQSEMEGNASFNALYKERSNKYRGIRQRNIDFFFGIFAFKNTQESVDKLFTHYSLDSDQLQLFPVYDAIIDGLPLANIPVRFRYPIRQKANESQESRIPEFADKRKSQREGILFTQRIHLLYRQGKIDPEIRFNKKGE